MKNRKEGLLIALEEMRLTLTQILTNGDNLDQKINVILTITGIVLALSSTIQLSTNQPHQTCFWIVLIITYIAFITSVTLSLISLFPNRYKLPLGPKWSNLDEFVFKKTEKDMILGLMAGYSDAIQYNEEINNRKGIFHRISIILIIVTFGLIFCLFLLK